LFRIAGIPPNVAQVPSARTAAARGASPSIHVHVEIGSPLDGSTPIVAQYPSPLISSLGTEPSSTKMNGSSLPAAASNHGRMNSSPVSYASNGL
jgi:hypothetical protein